MELNDILSEKEEVAPPVEAPTEVVAPDPGVRVRHQEKEAQAVEEGKKPRDPESGKFVPKEEPKVEVKAEEMTPRERAAFAKAQDEVRKRQELERKLAEYEKKTEKPAEAKSFWDDPEGHLKKHEETIKQAALQTRLETTEAIARDKYKDFDEKIEVFAEQLQQTPGLHAQWLASPNPAEFAYKHGKYTKELRDAGSIDALRAQIEKETRIKLEAEFKAKQEALEKQRAAIPSSLSDVRGASKQNQVFTGPPSLEDILNEK